MDTNNNQCETCIFFKDGVFCRLFKRRKDYKDGTRCRHYSYKSETYQSPYL